MNDFQIFNSDEFERMKSIESTIKSSYLGFIYFLEYGENIKIGYSQKPSNRMKQLKNQAEYGKIKLGNVAINKPHTNYRENEKLLHQYFNQSRIAGTELFSVTLKQILSDLPKDLKFLDESEKLEQKSKQGLEVLKRTFLKLWEIEPECRISYTQEQLDHVENLHITQKKEVSIMQNANTQGVKRIHVYKDKNGNPLAEKHITKQPDGEKRCYWYAIDPQTGAKKKGLNGMKLPLYHANQLHNAKENISFEVPIFFAEGEKDVETLERIYEAIATCTPNGGAATSWNDDYNEDLKFRTIIILTDNDSTGEKYGQTIAKHVSKVAIGIKIISAKAIWNDCPEHGDISDIVQALGEDKARELLSNAIEKAKYYIDMSNT
ncbi:MAG: GIY-YIG nuclease family protein, partial [Oscillospiraceae bacterium]|nr:GIY-YIG nuclease family protein [Oscillospiraceae bacterium]